METTIVYIDNVPYFYDSMGSFGVGNSERAGNGMEGKGEKKEKDNGEEQVISDRVDDTGCIIT